MEDQLYRKSAPFAEIYLEKTIYEILGPHPRIVKYCGTDINGLLLLQRLPKGDLLTRLMDPTIACPLSLRIKWALEIAEGLEHLHANHILWNDCHFGNILITDDEDAVLTDFGASYIKPTEFTEFVLGPPLAFSCPDDYRFTTPYRHDLFAFGIVLFVLVSDQFPHSSEKLSELSTAPIAFEQYEGEGIRAYELHQAHVFDVLPHGALSDALHSSLNEIIQKCFNISYGETHMLVTDLKMIYETLRDCDNGNDMSTNHSVESDQPSNSQQGKL